MQCEATYYVVLKLRQHCLHVPASRNHDANENTQLRWKWEELVRAADDDVREDADEMNFDSLPQRLNLGLNITGPGRGGVPFKCKTITHAWNSLVATLTCESQSGKEWAECRRGTLSSHQAETERPAAAAAASWCCLVQQFHPNSPIPLNYILVPDMSF